MIDENWVPPAFEKTSRGKFCRVIPYYLGSIWDPKTKTWHILEDTGDSIGQLLGGN